MRPRSLFFLLLVLIAGCGGSSRGSAPQGATRIYVPYFCFNSPSSVQVFDAEAEGAAAPIAVLQGDQTGITAAAAVALDREERLYVANADSETPAILVFAAGANGNLAPIRTISGPNTQLNAPFGVAVDSGGNVFVANEGGSSILKFAAGADGDAAPAAVIAGSDTGLAPPPLGPLAITLDRAGRIYVTSVPDNSLLIFAPDADGNAAPLKRIAGDATQLDGPVQAVLDRAGNIYVSDNTHCYPNCTGSEPFAITVYPPGASGNMAPLRTISGGNTQLFLPAGIAVDEAGRVYATNQKTNAVQIFPAGSEGNIAPRTINGSSAGACVARAVAVNQGQITSAYRTR